MKVELCYKIFDLEINSGLDTVKKRYKKLVKKNHPDLFPDCKKKEQDDILVLYNKAYKIIKDYLENSLKPAKHIAEKHYHKQKPANDINEEVKKKMKNTTFDSDKNKEIHCLYNKGVDIYDKALLLLPKLSDGNLEKKINYINKYIKLLKSANDVFLKVLSYNVSNQWSLEAKKRIKDIENSLKIFKNEKNKTMKLIKEQKNKSN